MNPIDKLILKSLRKAYQKLFVPAPQPYDRGITDPDEASKVIYDMLASGKPCMIARYGAFELATIVNYLGILSPKHSVWKYIKGEQPQWWWNRNLMRYMQTNAGFFPATEENLNRFGRMMLEDSKQLDMLGSWLRDERMMLDNLHLSIPRCSLLLLEPYWASNPWSRVLEGKKVLVVHPFAPLIEQQYRENRTRLFKDKRVLPAFELHTLQAVQSLGGQCERFTTWFEALDWMKGQMDHTDYDIVLIGCGAYGFPLAAHAKRTGKQAVHLGGALQLLFGIKGKRWENPEYGARQLSRQNAYNELTNKYWIRPAESLKPFNAKHVENACYW